MLSKEELKGIVFIIRLASLIFLFSEMFYYILSIGRCLGASNSKAHQACFAEMEETFVKSAKRIDTIWNAMDKNGHEKVSDMEFIQW